MKDKPIFYYIDTVYTALCFGWIDSTLEKKDGARLQKFIPRQKKQSLIRNKQRKMQMAN